MKRYVYIVICGLLIVLGGCRPIVSTEPRNKISGNAGGSESRPPQPAFTANAVVPLPHGSFDAQDATNGWVVGTGVSIDTEKGGKAPGALKLSVDAKKTITQSGMLIPVRLQPWRRHRLSFVYQLSPGVTGFFSLSEKGADGILHVRRGSNYIRLAPAEAFTPVSVEFISWPEPAEWTLTFDARLIQGAAKPGCFLIDDVVLESGPAAQDLPAETIPRAVVNHGFESPQIAGYQNLLDQQVELAVVDDATAHEGKRCLRMKPKGEKGSAHIYIPIRHDLILQEGHCYRISAWARGTGGLTIGLSIPNPTRWLLDINHPAMSRVFPLSPEQWREVRADYIMENGDLQDVQALLLPDGQVDIDDLEIRRLR